MQLTTNNFANELRLVFLDCLYSREEQEAFLASNPPPNTAPEGAVIVDGITARFGLHPKRLESHRDDVKAFIDMLDPSFLPEREGGKGGWSFLKLPMDKNGVQWGEQANAQELVVLAIGLKLGSYLMPRALWSLLPGGVPYIVFSKTEIEDLSKPMDIVADPRETA